MIHELFCNDKMNFFFQGPEVLWGTPYTPVTRMVTSASTHWLAPFALRRLWTMRHTSRYCWMYRPWVGTLQLMDTRRWVAVLHLESVRVSSWVAVSHLQSVRISSWVAVCYLQSVHVSSWVAVSHSQCVSAAEWLCVTYSQCMSAAEWPWVTVSAYQQLSGRESPTVSACEQLSGRESPTVSAYHQPSGCESLTVSACQQLSGCESPTVIECQNTCICFHSTASESRTRVENVSDVGVSVLSRPRVGRTKNRVSMLGEGKAYSFPSNRQHRFWDPTCLINDCRGWTSM